ncbi:unnamed protein product [Closterium sp. NIES-65]|nr:unnamed protein product [Closterium sp. NIES-65]
MNASSYYSSNIRILKVSHTTRHFRRSCCFEAAIPTAVVKTDADSKGDSSQQKFAERPLLRNAIIVGGGIAGLTAAIALRRQGVDVQVYEKAEGRDPERVGRMVGIQPNGLAALRCIDPTIADAMTIASTYKAYHLAPSRQARCFWRPLPFSPHLPPSPYAPLPTAVVARRASGSGEVLPEATSLLIFPPLTPFPLTCIFHSKERMCPAYGSSPHPASLWQLSPSGEVLLEAMAPADGRFSIRWGLALEVLQSFLPASCVHQGCEFTGHVEQRAAGPLFLSLAPHSSSHPTLSVPLTSSTLLVSLAPPLSSHSPFLRHLKTPLSSCPCLWFVCLVRFAPRPHAHSLYQANGHVTAHFTRHEQPFSAEADLLMGTDGVRAAVRQHVLKEADLLIGTNGVRSAVRQHVLREGEERERWGPPQDDGRTMWLGAAPRETIVRLGGGRTAAVGDLGGAEIFVLFVCADEQGRGLTQQRSANGEEVRGKIRALFADWPAYKDVIEVGRGELSRWLLARLRRNPSPTPPSPYNQAVPPDLFLERRVLDVPPLSCLPASHIPTPPSPTPPSPCNQAAPPDLYLERRVLDVPPLPRWRNGRILIIGATSKLLLPHHADQMQRMRCRPHLPPYSLHLSHMLPSNASSPSCRLDAAHAVPPTLGQGSSLAVEDALELARQVVADHPSLECVV